MRRQRGRRLLAVGAGLATVVLAALTSVAFAGGSPTNPADLPLGDGHVSTATPVRGSIYTCQTAPGGAGGAFAEGPWIHGTTFDFSAKTVVQGSVSWPGSVSI